MLNRTIQPPIIPISKIPFPNIERSTLGNGLPLHLIHDEAQEIVRIDFMFGCGSWHQTRPLISFLTNQMLKEGSANLNSQQIAEKLDFYGSSLQLSSSYHHSYLTVYSLTKYVKETLAVVEEMLKCPNFPKTEFEVLVNKRKQHFLLDEEKVQILASKQFSTCIYGKNHPYGKMAILKDFETVSIDDVKTFYTQYYGSKNCQIIIAGDITDNLLAEVEKLFGTENWGAKSNPAEPQFNIQSESEKVHLIQKKDAVQSAVRIGRVGIPRNHPDFHSLKVVSTIFGGYFGSRLMTNVREEKGYTYGIGSSLSALRQGGSFCISTETATKYVQLLIKEVYNEMGRLCTEPVGKEELMMAKNFMLGDAARLFDGTFSMADCCISLLANDLDLSFYEKQIQTIREISAEQIQALAQKYFVRETFYEIIAGKK